MKTETATAINTILLLWQKLKNERVALGRRIEGLELALDALGHKFDKSDHAAAPTQLKPRGPKPGGAGGTGHTLRYLIKEALYATPDGMSLKDIGTHLARRGVETITHDSVSGSLSALKVKELAERTSDGIWKMTDKGRTQMSDVRAAS